MSWLLDPPFVLFETPLWIQVAIAIPYWAVYFAIKGIIRWREKRASKRWLEYLAPMSRNERDRAVVARFKQAEREHYERYGQYHPWLSKP